MCLHSTFKAFFRKIFTLSKFSCNHFHHKNHFHHLKNPSSFSFSGCKSEKEENFYIRICRKVFRWKSFHLKYTFKCQKEHQELPFEERCCETCLQIVSFVRENLGKTEKSHNCETWLQISLKFCVKFFNYALSRMKVFSYLRQGM